MATDSWHQVAAYYWAQAFMALQDGKKYLLTEMVAKANEAEGFIGSTRSAPLKTARLGARLPAAQVTAARHAVLEALQAREQGPRSAGPRWMQRRRKRHAQLVIG